MQKRKIRVAITHGDINGISYEVILKSLFPEELLDLFTPVVYGSKEIELFWRKQLSLEGGSPWCEVSGARAIRDGQVNLINCTSSDLSVELGQVRPEAGLAALEAIEMATADLMAGLVDVLVTAPIHKAAMPQDRFPFEGHTDYLEQRFSSPKSLMILASEDLRVALATTHVPLSRVPQLLTPELIASKAQLLADSLSRDFGIGKSRIAILALNPHAGENGKFGEEEQAIISPALDLLDERGVFAFGPYPADGWWGSDLSTKFDGVLALYHDQGLAPFKALYMERGVNFTAGLPYVRTSPDHGTGYDIAGKGIASSESMRMAIYMAIDIYRNRRSDEEARRRPLKRLYQYSSRDDEKIDLAIDELSRE